MDNVIDPRSEYNLLKKQVLDENPNSVYTEVMNKSDRVLDTINRVMDTTVSKRRRKKDWRALPLGDLFGTSLTTLNDVIEELSVGPPPQTDNHIQWVSHVLFKNQRGFFIGFVLVAVSILIFVMYEL